MERRILGRTGLAVSPVCVGSWQLAGPLFFNGKPDGHPDPGREPAIRLIRALGDEGVNFVDAAEQYGAGEAERRVGEAIRGRRDEWVVSTKFGYRVGPGGERDDSASPARIRSSIEGSLRRLRTDYIDVYLYHCAPEPGELAEGKVVLDTLVKEGKCRFYGISTNDVDLLRRMAELDMLHVVQYHANLLHEQPEIDALAAAHRIGTQVRGAMAEGRLSGKYFSRQPGWRSDDRRSQSPEDFTRYAALERFLPGGYTIRDAAIRWILDNPNVHSICLGAKSLEDYRAAIRAAGLPPLTAEARSRLAEGVRDLC